MFETKGHVTQGNSQLAFFPNSLKPNIPVVPKFTTMKNKMDDYITPKNNYTLIKKHTIPLAFSSFTTAILRYPF